MNKKEITNEFIEKRLNEFGLEYLRSPKGKRLIHSRIKLILSSDNIPEPEKQNEMLDNFVEMASNYSDFIECAYRRGIEEGLKAEE